MECPVTRILVVDDEPAMHDSYRRSFAPARSEEGQALDAMAAALFDDVEEAGDGAASARERGIA